MEPQKIEPNQVDNRFKKTHNHYWAIGIIILLSLVYVSLSFYVSLSKDLKSNCVSGVPCREEQSDVNITLVNDVVDWKTYRDDKYGFEFKYSSDPENNGSYFREMNIRVLENNQKIPLVDWIEENEEFYDSGSLSVKIYGNNNAVVANTSSDGGVGKTVYFENRDKIVAFDLFVFYKDKVPLEKYLSDFEQVLSTFKFTEIPITTADYEKPFQKGPYDYFGTLNLTGYVEVINGVCDPKMEGDIPCAQLTYYKAAVFHVTDSDSSLFKTWLGGVHQNNLVGPDKVVLGCYDESKKMISYINSGDDGVVRGEIDGADLSSILSSTKSSPVKIQMIKSYNTAGKGAPLCYSVFRDFKVVK